MDVYAVKKTQFLGKPVTYICQNINGPCPLLAICNVLILRGHVTLDKYVSDGCIAANDVIRVVGDHLIASNPPLTDATELARLTQQRTLEDVTKLLPSLLVGLDVNVRFNSTTDFEYTVACAVFDMLDISLVHGWLLDIQDEKTCTVVQNKSYNELIELLVDYRAVLMTEESTNTAIGDDEEKSPPPSPSGPSHGTHTRGSLTIDVRAPLENVLAGEGGGSPNTGATKSPSKQTVEVMMKERHMSGADAMEKASRLLEDGPVLEEFFNSSASQLTYYGLVKMHEEIRDRKLCVFFRNNHFSTLFKHDGALYLLVTDAGYLDEPSVVWELLNEIDGDTEYFDENFRQVNAMDTRQQTIMRQREEAQRLRELEEAEQQGDSSRDASEFDDPTQLSSNEVVGESGETQNPHGLEAEDPDFLLALRLQEEEEAQARPARVSPRASPRSALVTESATANSENHPGDDFPTEGLGLSEEEIQQQRDAELYYKQRKLQMEANARAREQQQRQEQQQFAARREDAPARSDCVVMWTLVFQFALLIFK
ncbi:TPA: hypothetical protein N0F65_002482 [Lagenidium giganteum]|uniref:MINDY deubiquitinase domain-containing protein n=1 Tax=Lagenidium giganteum TaxID=4803 RepID=A0AAV2YX92_9STRA|nr:TPA: hypothetical protein N0F65_002482 [Lagenidium giganteum]